MDILEIFYNSVIPEAMNGRINCLSYYNMAFSTEIVDEGKKYPCNIDVLSFPFELDSCLHIGINDKKMSCNNTLLYKTYKLVEEGISKNKDSFYR